MRLEEGRDEKGRMRRQGYSIDPAYSCSSRDDGMRTALEIDPSSITPGAFAPFVGPRSLFIFLLPSASPPLHETSIGCM